MDDVRRAIGKVGVWTFALDPHTAAREAELVREIEAMGFKALWFAEGRTSKEALSHAALMLNASSEMVVASGIANIWARDPTAMANGGRVLAEAFPGRFILGVGVSHRAVVDKRGAHTYDKPLQHMRDYLSAMQNAPYTLANAPRAPVVLAALGPKMLRLAASQAAGAHPYFVPVEHTAFARGVMGPGPLLAPEQMVVLATDAGQARSVARGYMSHYLKLENYSSNLVRLGFSDQDLADGGSDKLVDAIVAWGDAETVAKRVREHLDAGADHVSIQVLKENPADFPLEELSDLASVLIN